MTDNKAESTDSGTHDDTQNETLDTSVNTLNCSVCNVNLEDQGELHQHLVGKKHKKAYRVLEEQQRVNKKCGLYIKGFRNTIRLEELLNHFEKFGNVVWVHMGIGFLLLDYEDPESADQVLKKTQFINGSRLFIKRREYKEPRVQKIEDDDDLLAKLKDVDDVSVQIDIFKDYFQVDFPSNYAKYQRVYRDLFDSLSDNFPQCHINPFGSTVTGLCFRNSDLDVYISGINRGNNDTVQYLYTIREILNRYRKFINILVIAHAKIPIIKCLHKETAINCDINLKNILGVCNSNLIKYYINIDHKIKNVMIILKYWARVHKITGQNHLFTNYALCLMVIFFLQQRPYCIPNVLCLQKLDRFHYTDGYWVGGFREVPLYRSTIETLRKTTVLELLTGFFDFYSKFDYEKQVICPYLGRVLEKEAFKTPEKLPKCYFMYKEYVKVEDHLPLKVESCICIQDPFEHARNTTSVILGAVLNKFINFCILGHKLCGNGAKNLFYSLFTEDLQVEKKISRVKSSEDNKTIKMSMKQNLKYLQKKIQESDEKLDRVVAEKDAWFETVKEFAKTFFRDILDFDVQEDHSVDAVPAKHKKENNQMNVHDSKNVHWKCSAKLNVWDCRKSKTESLKNNEFNKKNFIEKEIAITQTIKDSCGVKPVAKLFEFDLLLTFHSDPASVDVTLKKVSSYKNVFKSFLTTFRSFFLESFEKYEKMLDLELGNRKDS